MRVDRQWVVWSRRRPCISSFDLEEATPTRPALSRRILSADMLRRLNWLGPSPMPWGGPPPPRCPGPLQRR